MRSSSIAALSIGACILASAALPARAFDIPDDQSCGGLVCDLGLFGHKVAPAAAAPVFKAPKPAAEAAIPPATPPQRAVEAARPATPRKHIAKAAAQPVEPPLALRASSGLETPVVAPVPHKTRAAARAVSTATLQDFVPAGMAKEEEAPVLPVPPPPHRDLVVLANPYVTTQPAPLAFQSVDPSVGAR